MHIPSDDESGRYFARRYFWMHHKSRVRISQMGITEQGINTRIPMDPYPQTKTLTTVLLPTLPPKKKKIAFTKFDIGLS